MGKPMMPKGGNDKVWTPEILARRLVHHFSPAGYALEPCYGTGNFYRALKRAPHVTKLNWCEIDKDIDFLDWSGGRVDWIVTNPPWSQFRPFLVKSMEIADNVVFLALLNAWFMKARVRDMEEAGFGLAEILLVDTPPKPWPQTGFQLAAVHIQRGYSGDIIWDRLVSEK